MRPGQFPSVNEVMLAAVFRPLATIAKWGTVAFPVSSIIAILNRAEFAYLAWSIPNEDHP